MSDDKVIIGIDSRKHYPDHAYKNRTEWLRDVRKRWTKFRKKMKEDGVTSGCAYYPKEVYEWLCEFDKMDEKMKEFYDGV